MTEKRRTYSALSAEEQSALSVWIDSFEQGYAYEGGAALKKAVKEAPGALSGALLTQLLPPLIDHDRKQQGRTPTLHELRSRFPDLAGEITDAYAQMPSDYRLPVEIRGYRVIRVVGEGGQAIVLRAQDDVHSAVAIKLSAAPEHNDLLLRERGLLGQCQHQGVPEVIASGIEEERAYFVMPFLRGMTLADKYATHRATAQEVVRIGAELCDIVAHLHAQSILHRDIKPQNVWIDEAGGVKLIDLGMAIDRSSWGSPRVAIEEFNGTPAFMSPEQAAADGQHDGELSDVFSVGAVLYWMMTGLAPFDADSPQESLARAKSAAIDRAKLLKTQSYPAPLKSACLRALTDSAQARIASAKELRELLLRPRRRKAPFALVTALATVVLGSVWLLSRPFGEATPPPNQVDVVGDEAPPVANLPPGSREAEQLGSEDRQSLASPSDPQPDASPPSGPEQRRSQRATPLAALDTSRFRVALDSVHRYREPFGSRADNSKKRGVLVVHPLLDQGDLSGSVQYRIDDLPWKPMRGGNRDGDLFAFLDSDEATKRGPIELRFMDDTGKPIDATDGPLKYRYDVAKMLKEENDRFMEGLFRNAASVRCMGVTEAGWTIDEAYSERYTSTVRDMWYTDEQGKPMRSVATQVATILGDANPGDSGRPTYTLKQAFALVSRDVRSSQKLWVKLDLRNGETIGPTLYTPAKVAVSRYKEQATAPFEWLGPERDAAIFSGEKLTLTGLREALPRLTELHVVGEYRESTERTGQKPSSTSSSSGARRSSTIVLDAADLLGDGTVQLPPTWSSVTISGRMTNGAMTPGFNARNSAVHCGRALQPVTSSSDSCSVEAYLYVAHDQLPVKDLSILPHLPKADALPPEAIRQSLATRLKLKAMLPRGATRVEFYSDAEFRRPAAVASPGMLYALYTGSDGKAVGHTTYRISPSVFEEWIDHGLGHFHLPGIEAYQANTSGGQDE